MLKKVMIYLFSSYLLYFSLHIQNIIIIVFCQLFEGYQ